MSRSEANFAVGRVRMILIAATMAANASSTLETSNGVSGEIWRKRSAKALSVGAKTVKRLEGLEKLSVKLPTEATMRRSSFVSEREAR